MLARRLALLALLPFLLLLMALRDAPLVDPDPLAIPPKVGNEQVAKAVKLALAHRGWIVIEEKPGEIASTLHLRDHTARIPISWDKAQIHIRYVDSVNLKYHVEDGKPYIHKNYLDWVNNLIADISGNLAMVSM